MVDERVSLIDRSTIRAWRIANLLGWTALGVVAAVYFRFAGEAAATLLFRSQGMGISGNLPLGFGAAIAVPSSVVAGVAAGTLVGGRAYRWPVILSGTAGTIAALVWWLMYTGAFSVHGAVGLGTALVMVPVAALAGRRAWWIKRSWQGDAGGSTGTIGALALARTDGARMPTRRKLAITALVAAILVVVPVVLVSSRHEPLPLGPLQRLFIAGRPGAISEPGHAVTIGVISFSHGQLPSPLVFESIRPYAEPPELAFRGFFVVRTDLSGPVGVVDGVAPGPRFTPLAGYTVRGDLASVQIAVAVEATRQGAFAFPEFVLRYRIGSDQFEAVSQSGMWICTKPGLGPYC
jgi:hypothetical protein